MVAKQNALPKTRAMTASSETPETRTMRVVRGLVTPTGQPPLDRIIHDRIRLAIVSALAANEVMTFSELKQLLQTSDGNLSVHARKLEEAHYLSVTKYFEGKTPKTEYRLTKAGRRALENYLGQMESLIQAMRDQ
ncbi:transcriptional regulator [candidate division KSB1 bacterium]|nr:MAG: transcriptional regulator [candidate division KSB1 bacterium]MCE7944341.1 transcriptional regulator [Chlorobi bacterium CHB1]MDL1876714.1 transcriptional regulator [Cytophagia bacterium CHB2]